MAATSRSDRQLMRQRGAGTRVTNDVDFGFDMRGGREQRQLMRQRGAGNRQIDNIDFGLAFPSESRRSRSKTPQAESRPASRSSQTPRQSSREPSASNTSRRSSTWQSRRPSVQRRTSPVPQTADTSADSRTKRRKLSENDGAAATSRSVFGPLQEVQQAKALSRDIFHFAEEPHRSQTEVNEEEDPASTRGEYILATIDEGFADKENTRLSQSATKGLSKRKKRRSIGQKSQRGKKRGSGASERESLVLSVEAPEENSFDNNNAQEQQIEQGSVEMVEETNVQPLDKSPFSHRQAKNAPAPKKRRKRKSVVLGRKKRRSSGNTTFSTVQDEQEDVPEKAAGSNNAHASTSEVSANLVTTRVMPERFSSKDPPLPNGEADEEADETYIPDEATPEPTPAPKRKRSGKAQPLDDGSENQSRTNRTKSSFPVQIHRINHVEALPTITEADEPDYADHESSERIPAAFSNRTAPNGVDVLAQICRETIATSMERMESQRDPSIGRAELKRKRTALEAFGSDLNDRLFDMSEAVEQRLTLEARLRKSKREKAELQLRWIEIRRQRDKLALKSDAIRKQHWEDEERSKKLLEISEAAMAAEMELERGRDEEQQESLEVMLRTIIAGASRTSSCGGILAKVQAFNGQLERLVSVLEKR